MKYFLFAAMLSLVYSDSALQVAPCSAGECCRICTKGKACGDSCIAKDAVCHIVGGCACNGKN